MKFSLHQTSKNRKRALRKSLLLCNSCAGLPCWQSRFNFWEILGRLYSSVQSLRVANLQNRLGVFFFVFRANLVRSGRRSYSAFTSRLLSLTCIKTPPKKLAPVLPQILKFHVVPTTSALCRSSFSWFAQSHLTLSHSHVIYAH